MALYTIWDTFYQAKVWQARLGGDEQPLAGTGRRTASRSWGTDYLVVWHINYHIVSDEPPYIAYDRMTRDEPSIGR